MELLAYVGDHLSYYQDAVATEVYLDTARQRITVRRNARLVDYPMHEGCNARTWVCVETNSDLALDPKDIYFITAADGINQVVLEQDLQHQISGGYEIFEPMSDAGIKLYAGHHEIQFYTWGDEEYCLPRGTTMASLKGDWVEEPLPESVPTAIGQKLHLKTGDVLILEEVIGPKSGNPADADSKHRHAVRLTDIQRGYDPLNPDITITEITWAVEDALPFPLCLSAMGPPPQCIVIKNISVARGNLILVDHGMTVHEELEPVQIKETLEECDCLGTVTETVVIPERYVPVLKQGPLIFGQPIESTTPAKNWSHKMRDKQCRR